MFRRLLCFAILLLPALLTASCSKSTHDRLIGTWQEGTEAANVITFAADGTLRQDSYGTSYTATWTVLNEGSVEVRFTGESERLGKTVLAIRFTDDRLQTTNAAGRLQEWRRQ